jgi:transcriptional regulator with XRE-family HTH domain
MFWENFKQLCAQNDITPNAVAKKLGISSGSITAWKNGRMPKLVFLQKLADYFDVTVEYFFINHNEEKEPEATKKDPDKPELTEAQKAIVELFMQIPEEQQPLVLEMIRAALKNLK